MTDTPTPAQDETVDLEELRGRAADAAVVGKWIQVHPTDLLEILARVEQAEREAASQGWYIEGLERRIEQVEVERDAALARVEQAETEVGRLHGGQRCPQCSAAEWNGAALARAERDAALKVIADVRALANEAEEVPVHAGGGNLVTRRRMVPVDRLRALLPDDEEDAS